MDQPLAAFGDERRVRAGSAPAAEDARARHRRPRAAGTPDPAVAAPRAAGIARRALLVAPFAGALAGCATPPAAPALALPPDAPTIHVVARDWHTDVGLPVGAIARTPLVTALVARFPGVRHLVFGFGERGFFTAPEPGSAELLAALFPGRGAILATGLRVAPPQAFDPAQVVALRVSSGGLDRLARFIWDALEKDAEGAPVAIQPGPYAGSVFYASSATYHLGYTCNTWTADALRAAGLPVEPAGVLFVGQLMARARRVAASQAEARRAGPDQAAPALAPGTDRHPAGAARPG